MLFQGGVLLGENAGPVTPAADRLLLHGVDVGGKTELAFRDSGGAIGRPLQDSWIVCTNNSGSSIAAYSVVRPTGASSGLPTIGLADADALATMPAMGLTMETIANGSSGRVMIQGLLVGPTTTGMTAGQAVYVSGTAGAFTQTGPSYPAFRQVLGQVGLVGGAGTGILVVNVSHFFRQAGYPIPLPFFYGSTLTANVTGVGKFPITTNMAGTITEVRAKLGTTSSSGSVVLTFRRNGAAAFATITIAAAATSGSSTGLSQAVVVDDYITVDITSFGTGASDLVGVAELMTAG